MTKAKTTKIKKEEKETKEEVVSTQPNKVLNEPENKNKVVVTQDVLDENPELKEAGIQVGDIGEVVQKEENRPVNNKDFKFSITFNNQTFTFIDEDLVKNVISVAPIFLKTKIILVLEKDGKRAEKQLLGFQARQLFRNEMFRRITLQRLILK